MLALARDPGNAGRKSRGSDWFRPQPEFRGGGPLVARTANADAALHPFLTVIHDLLVVRGILDAMLRKSLAKGLRASAARSFHSSAPARKVVATNPVKAQEVQVCLPSFRPVRF